MCFRFKLIINWFILCAYNMTVADILYTYCYVWFIYNLQINEKTNFYELFMSKVIIDAKMVGRGGEFGKLY